MEVLNKSAWWNISIVVGVAAAAMACQRPTTPAQEGDSVALRPPSALKKVDNSAEFTAYLKASFTRLASVNPNSGALNGIPSMRVTRAVPATMNATADAAAGGGGAAPVSQTNLVEQGVDETDIVKTDGSRLYVLERGQQIYYALPMVVGAAQTGDTGPVMGAQLVRPQPSTTTPSKIRVLKSNGTLPGVSEETTIPLDESISYVQGMFLVDKTPDTAGADTLFVIGQGPAITYDPQHGFYSSNPQVVVMAFDVSNPATPVSRWKFAIEGNLNTTRSLNNRIYLVTQKYAWPKNLILGAVSAQDLASNQQTIDELRVEDLLPITTVNGTVRTVVRPQDCMIPTNSAQGALYAGDLLTLIALPFDDPTQATSLCTMETAATVYASNNAIYVTANEFVSSTGLVNYSYEMNTFVHQFNIAANGFVYQASGRVPGWLGWSSAAFRLQESQNTLRMVTTRDTWSRTPQHELHVLAPSARDPGVLDIVASLPNRQRPDAIGKPGEDIRSVRFTRAHAYIVTFQRTDPLYVINLAAANDPYIEGTLEIPGFSEYLHPLGEDHLLGVGQDAVTVNMSKDPANPALVTYTQGIVVGLFDVTDKSKPDQIGKLIIGKRGSRAAVAADSDYKAFAIVSDTAANKYRVMLPVAVNDDPSETVVPSPGAWYPWLYNGAKMLEIGTGGAQWTLRDAGTLVTQRQSSNQSYIDFSEPRALIIGDIAYAVQGAKVWSAPWSTPKEVVGPQ